MDQVTQVLLGGVAAQAAFSRPLGRRAWLVGGAAAFLPDLDMALTAFADPLFPIEVHRTFSHALVVAPLGAALATLLFLPVAALRRRWGAVYGAALVGWLTHAPLDACTSYGTMLFWPLDRTWVAWDLVAIIDPLFSLVLLAGLVLALRRRAAGPAVAALLVALLYLGLGALQRERALGLQADLARSRGHEVEHGRVMPILGSILLWRSLYLEDGKVHADALRLLPGAAAQVHEGGSVPAFTAADLPGDLPDGPHLRTVFDRYLVFADGFLARTPGDETIVGDMRYSATYGFDPIWGMQIGNDVPPAWAHRRRVTPEALEQFLGTVVGTAGAWRPLPAPPVDAAHRPASPR